MEVIQQNLKNSKNGWKIILFMFIKINQIEINKKNNLFLLKKILQKEQIKLLKS